MFQFQWMETPKYLEGENSKNKWMETIEDQ